MPYERSLQQAQRTTRTGLPHGVLPGGLAVAAQRVAQLQRANPRSFRTLMVCAANLQRTCHAGMEVIQRRDGGWGYRQVGVTEALALLL